MFCQRTKACKETQPWKKGNKWKRPDDVWGIASVLNGISKDHRNFLKSHGYGFIIGDGALNYAHEAIIETFYNAHLSAHLAYHRLSICK